MRVADGGCAGVDGRLARTSVAPLFVLEVVVFDGGHFAVVDGFDGAFDAGAEVKRAGQNRVMTSAIASAV